MVKNLTQSSALAVFTILSSSLLPFRINFSGHGIFFDDGLFRYEVLHENINLFYWLSIACSCKLFVCQLQYSYCSWFNPNQGRLKTFSSSYRISKKLEQFVIFNLTHYCSATQIAEGDYIYCSFILQARKIGKTQVQFMGVLHVTAREEQTNVCFAVLIPF